ncbi:MULTISPECIES: FKBP-type peptidyl-prolyl cis-trans isomerase [unclassified Lysobacter]|uniref:FKBP-type peptidyl-prolyl cis-trans isomerase n=1 Tax=unclassified Lysobacter TaxID=2635362 RepID=UPI001BEC2F7E|nr:MULTISPECIES: FKBP-type peptidyl-prolyl cis-trans isomerase [unclassified Lysobacter]MBT2745809.1 FKBP-type peptidyl-prolyl cis-trans isomerase [Lysobacter sp. ISL-42]MBT2749632.1 FKBP-type peptidyl-prolyl cis-trans isomerase [Lysobacter sp. ISL-50]MBT2777649.1 FKBP-type peptidyl-prolyl cis-trans isomerase [Lysobacter sp. ISL-54]MBT2782137.1 FKBP-type peptidyl-prolyl cis-trans isomerase [Lysobacter sp. ISL-52]
MPRPSLSPLALSLSALLALSACTASKDSSQGGENATAAPALTAAQVSGEKARISYIVGRDFAANIEPIRGELDTELVLRAIRDAQAGRASLFDEAQSKKIREGFSEHLRGAHDAQVKAVAARNLETGAAFLKKNAQVAGVETTASGLQYQVLREGKGAHPKASDTVRVNYLGRLLDGSKFESTYDTDHPAEFVLAQVMPGWTEGVQLMTPGAKYRFWVPAKLAYGERGMAGQIEPNSVLDFEIELLEIAGEGGPVHDE